MHVARTLENIMTHNSGKKLKMRDYLGDTRAIGNVIPFKIRWLAHGTRVLTKTRKAMPHNLLACCIRLLRQTVFNVSSNSINYV